MYVDELKQVAKDSGVSGGKREDLISGIRKKQTLAPISERKKLRFAGS